MDFATPRYNQIKSYEPSIVAPPLLHIGLRRGIISDRCILRLSVGFQCFSHVHFL